MAKPKGATAENGKEMPLDHGERSTSEPSKSGRWSQAPQPTDTMPADAQDVALLFFVNLAKLCKGMFQASLLSFFFWSGFLYVTGATLVVVGFTHLSPSIDGVPACPSKQSGYLMASFWFLLAILNFCTAHGYLTVQSVGMENFRYLSIYMQVLGFLSKVVPTYSRLLHVFSLFIFNVIVIQVLFLPECNAIGLITVIVLAQIIWWAVILLGVICKRRLLVPPYMYEPLRPGASLLQELQKLMRAIGP